MKTYPIISRNESGKCLYNRTCVNLNFQFKDSHRVLIKGVVTNPNGLPLKNVGVEVVQVNKNTNEEISLGVVFTEYNGEYGVSIEVSSIYDYYLNAYSAV